MQTIAKFLKISKEQFINDFKNTLDNYDESQIENIYESIKLPKEQLLVLLDMIFILQLILH